MPACEVVPYTHEQLCELIARGSGQAVEVFRASVAAAYFKTYLPKIDARSNVIEDEYIDHDYLEDYAAYCARCFHDYRRVCRRLHLFADALGRGDLIRVLEGEVRVVSPGGYELAERCRTYVCRSGRLP